MEDRLAQQIARQKRVRAMIESPRPKVVTPLEEALAKQRADAQPYIDRLTETLQLAEQQRDLNGETIGRLERGLRVVRAQVERSNATGSVPLAELITRVLDGERL